MEDKEEGALTLADTDTNTGQTNRVHRTHNTHNTHKQTIDTYTHF